MASFFLNRRILPLLTLVTTLGCGDATGPRTHAVVTVVEQTVKQQSAEAILHLVAEIKNVTSRPIYQMGCSLSLERISTTGDWQQVWSQVCLLVSGYNEFVIPANESRTITFGIQPNPGSVETVLPISGEVATYRLRMAILVENDLLELRYQDGRMSQLVTSNEFLVARP